MNNYERHLQIKNEQAAQELQNCALLLAYVFGKAGGWYGISKGSIDGFHCDYAKIDSNPGEFACHPMKIFCVTGEEDYKEELDEIRQEVKESFGMDDIPPVITLTEEEIEAAKTSVKEAIEQENPENIEEYLKNICGTFSDLSFCEWELVVSALKTPKN